MRGSNGAREERFLSAQGDPSQKRHANDLLKEFLGERSVLLLEPDEHIARRKLLTPLAGISLLVFYVLACQCISTLAVVRKETQSWAWPALMIVYMTTMAYVASLVIYQVGQRIG